MFIEVNNIYNMKSNQKAILDHPDVLQLNININPYPTNVENRVSS